MPEVAFQLPVSARAALDFRSALEPLWGTMEDAFDDMLEVADYFTFMHAPEDWHILRGLVDG